MKDYLLHIRKLMVVVCFVLSSIAAHSQQTLTQIAGYNAYVYLPPNYAASASTYPVIIFFPGIGEIGTNPAKLLAFGPNRLISQGVKMEFKVKGVTETPIFISVQPTSQWPNSLLIDNVLKEIFSKYKVDLNRVHLTGLSMGGWMIDQYLSDNNSARQAKIASVAVMHAPWINNSLSNFGDFASGGGRWWGIEGGSDMRKMESIADEMNGAKSKSAKYTLIPPGESGATHCCWNRFYDINYKVGGENIYEFMLSSSRNSTGPTPPPASNTLPTLNAGSNITITLPTNSTTLSGTASDADGSIASSTWTRISGPSNAIISSPGSLSTNVSNLVAGTYVFQLSVTDNSGGVSTGNVSVIVNGSPSTPPPNGSAGACNCDIVLQRMPDGGIYANGNTLNVKPGNTVCINAGTYPYLNLSNFNGAAGSPINIINCGGQVVISGGVSYGVSLTKSSFYKFSGKANSATKYGIKIDGGAKYFSSGLGMGAESTDFEVEYVEVTRSDVGVICKSNPTCDPATWEGAFEMRNISFHDMYVHDISGEGYYVGNTAPTVTLSCGGSTIKVRPQRLYNLKVYNNLVENTAWDGIQVASAPENCQVYNNVVRNFGYENHGSQQAGILFGGLCSGKLYNNYVEHGTGNGLQILGVGKIDIYNNVVYDAGGNTVNSPSQDGIFIDDRPIVGLPDPVVTVINNTVIKSKRSGIRLENTNKTFTQVNKFYNNLVVDPGEKKPDYAFIAVRGKALADIQGNINITELADAKFVNPAASDFHLTLSSPAIDKGIPVSNLGINSDLEGNTRSSGSATDAGAYELTQSGSNQPPTANAGADQTITLPVNTVTLTGIGGDADGSVTGYGWTKVSGPAATIVSPNTAQTAVNGLVAGTYTFRLTVTDDKGATSSANVTVTVNPAVTSNQVPTANAGTDQTITLPVNTVNLSGSGVDADGTIAGYSWTKVSGPAATIVSASSAQTAVNGLVVGTYTFRLTVTDDKGATSNATVTVTVDAAPVPNQAPTANAGANQTITLPVNTVTLNGSATDDDGTIASYSWTKVSGPTATIVSATGAQTVINNLVEGVYIFRLTVTDDKGATNSSNVTITVNAAVAPNQAPTANAGTSQTITLPVNSVSLTGTGTDTDGTIASYSWTKVSGPTATIVSATTAQTTINNLVEGVYTFSLTVTDDDGITGTATVTITVNAAPAPNQSPTANAGTNQTITLPVNSVTLTGTGTDADGTIAGYSWTKVSGPAATIVTATAAQTQVTGLVAGVYTFELAVTDDEGASGIATVTVTVKALANQPPTSNAGANQTITLPANSVTLTGSGTDADGTIAGYSWTKVSGPAATIASPTAAQTAINNLVAGVYTFRLTVTDDKGATSSSNVQITVQAAANQAPTSYAGSNQTITLPINTINLNGNGSDADGSIAGYSWTKVSGPAATIVSSSAAQTAVNGLVEGVYSFRLTVTDDDGATGTSTLTVTVNAATVPPVNLAPTANAGSNQTITLPVNSVTLTGAGADTDGTIAGYSWTKVSGPTANIATSSAAQTIVNGLVAGTYTFRLTVTDNDGATGTAVVTVTVKAVPNQVPTADAGTNQTITLPVNSVTLKGTGTDADGTIAGYNWTKVSGPTATIVSATAAQTTINNLVEGVYTFSLTVTDDKGAADAATVTVTVNAAVAPAPNKIPTANAGTNQTITLPVNSVTLTGTGADTDGTIAGYSWTKVSGPAATIVSATAAQTQVTGLVAGVYTFRLTVTDNDAATGVATVTVTVKAIANQAPTANAGTNQTITLPVNSVSLTGTGADTDGTIAGFSWTKVSGSTATIVSPTAAQTTINNLVAGVYSFRLTVTDDKGATNSSTVTVTVVSATAPGPNLAPTADAGEDKTVTLPVNSVSLTGTGVDTDGTITGYSWTKVSGSTATIVSPTAAQTTVNNLEEGEYTFSLTVTDNKGATSSSTVTITVIAAEVPAPNQAPTADAGTDQTITLPDNNVSLNGTGEDTDGSIAGYSWTKISGPAVTIANPTSAQTKITDLVEGVYVFSLTVTDDKGVSDASTVTVTVYGVSAPAPNQAPTANAGADQTITLPVNSVTLTGNGFDTDGSVVGYNWTKLSGANATIVNPKVAQITINNLEEGVYTFSLSVTDDKGGVSEASTVLVTVKAPTAPVTNLAPTASAGANQTITLPVNNITLTGTGTDTDGSIASYSWTKASGPAATIADPTAAQTTMSNLVEGVYTFNLTVTDDKGAINSSTVTITVNAAVTPVANLAPTANAGTNQTITLPTNSVTLTGTGVDTDGSIASYSWTKASGPTATIADPTAAQTTISNLVEGVYTFNLTVTDDKGAVNSSTVTITVNSVTITPVANIAPTANAGTNQTITLPINTVTLTGTGVDTDGSIASYGWTKVSGPTATIADPTAAQTTISNLVEGVYTFSLTVTDEKGAINSSTVTITVNAAVTPVANLAPTANAGTNVTITLPINSVTLYGTGVDTDGSIASYSWTKVSGSTATIADPTAAQTTITNLEEGVYTFSLTVTDDKGAINSSTVTITVNAATAPAPNLVPIANAGPDITITLPASNILLDGSASSDPDGWIVSYSWVKISGSNPSSLNNSNTNKPTFIADLTGVYVYELTVTDNLGAKSTDVVTIIVDATTTVDNKKPVANAGADVSLELSSPNLTLDGKNSSVDGGSNIYFNWKFLSGPSVALIQSPTKVSSPVTNLVEGEYFFELTVADDKGQTSKDTVMVTVVNNLKVTISLLIYPNPVTDMMKVRYTSEKMGKMSMRIFDANGKYIQTYSLEKQSLIFEKSINVSNLTPGPYFLRFDFDGEKPIIQKFIKMQ